MNRLGVLRSLLVSLSVPITSLLLLLALLLYPAATSEARPAGLEAAWERARRAGSYRFTADVVQTQIPLATVANVGRQSRQDELHLEGWTNLPQQTLEFTLWSDGGSVLDAASGIEVRVERERALARRGAQPWEEIAGFTGLFAPDSDFMAYLVATRNVVEQGSETRAGFTFTRYTFDIDGPRFARYMRDQFQQQLAERGELPPGTDLELPRVYVGMSGGGELWVGEDGLPLRQILHLDFPDTEDDQVQADVAVTFSDFGEGAASVSEAQRPYRRWLQRGMLSAATLAFLAVVVVCRRSRKLYAGLVVLLIFSLVVTPLLQSVHAAEFARRQADRAQEQEERAQEGEALREFEEALQEGWGLSTPSGPEALAMIRNDDRTDTDRDGLTDVQEAFLGTDPAEVDFDLLAAPSSAPLLEETGADSDADGLTDYQEELLGTDPGDWDTDGDTLTDTLEVAGFVFTDTHGIPTTFYTDPLQVDTNQDGIEDGQEWYTNGPADGRLPGDTDGDGTPDPFDRDNDADGVPDHVDMSPFQTTLSGTVSLTQTIILDRNGIFDQDQPFSLIVDNLVAGQPTYVEFHLRPTDPQHLWYAQNVLDWPEDRQGQVQDGDGGTFYDICWDAAVAEGKDPNEECKRSPNENGDVKLVPMLEIRISGPHDNLPPTATLQSMYGTFIQNLQQNGSEKAVYVPLQLVTDNKGGARVAFYGKMFYMPEESWGDAQQVRLVWAVQALVDECDTYADGQCSSYDLNQSNRVQVVHTYYDEWFLTGLNVREDHGQDAAVIWEDPAPGVDDDLHSDDVLIKLTHILDGAFMTGRLDPDSSQPDITVNNLYGRLNHSTNGDSPVDRWNLPDILNVMTGTFAHQDEALYTLAVTTTKSVLDGEFTPRWSSADPITPTLLFVRVEHYRSTNMDVWGNGYGFFWGGRDGSGNSRELTVDIGSPDPNVQHSRPVLTLVGQKWMPYSYDGFAWGPCPIDVYWGELDRRYGGVSSTGDPTEAAGERLLFQFYYLTLYQGMASVVQVGDRALQDALGLDTPGDVELAQSIVGGASSGFLFIVNVMVRKFSVNAHLVTAYLGSLKSTTSTLTVGDMNPSLLGQIKVLFKSDQYKALAVGCRSGIRWAVKHSLGVLGAGVAALGAVVSLALSLALTIASYFAENSTGLAIGAGILAGTAQVLMGVVIPIYTAWTLANALRGPGQSFAQAFKAVLVGKSEAIGSTTKASIVGLILSIGITIVFFIVQMAMGGLNSIQISMLVAQAIAQIIIAIVMFVLSQTVIGTIIVALLSIIDLILSLVGLEEWTSAALLAKAIYGYALIADPGVEIAGFDIGLVDPSAGMVDGAQLAVTATITASATMTNPKDPRAIAYMPVLWTERILRSSTVSVSLSVPVSDTASVAASRGVMKDQWNISHHHNYLAHNMRRAETVVQRTTVIELEAGINKTQPIYLNAGYALPIASCWMVPIPPLWYPVPICYDDSVKTDSASDVGASIVLDVFPSTLDEFYSLQWATFGPQRDPDSDGLLSTAYAGNDPSDTTWDCDGDGLSDLYEMEKRSRGAGSASASSPTSRDTDGDGLCDDQEIRLGTFPNMRDSDGDGLDDDVEVFHRDCWTGEWTGGWMFKYGVFTDTYGIPHDLMTRVTSDPLMSDTDVDGLDDKAERTLGTHPRVETPNPIILRTEVGDDDGFVAPNQAFIYTSTVENRIEHVPSFFYLGEMTVTLPSALGGGAYNTGAFNLYKDELASFTQTVAVGGGASSGEVRITNWVTGFMHDGDLTTYYAWQPMPRITDAEPAVDSPARVRIAAPPQATIPTFAVASVEGAETIGYRTADGQFSASTPNVRGEARPGAGLGAFSPGVACASDGTCLVAWGDGYYYNWACIDFKGFYCVWQWDEGGGFNPRSEFYVMGNYGYRIWSQGGVGDGDQFDLSGVEPYCFSDEAYINVMEEDCGLDSSVNKDDWMGTSLVTPYSPCEGEGAINVNQQWWHGDWACGHRYHQEAAWSEATAHLWWEMDLTPLETIEAALLDSGGHVAKTRFRVSDEWPEGQLRQQPSVASDGTNFLVVWQEYVPTFVGNEAPNWAIYARRVNKDGSMPSSAVRLDATWDFGSQYDERPAVAWVGDQYVVVWQTDRPDNIQSVSRAVVSQGGQFVERHDILGDIYTERLRPQIAYNPDTNQALLVYVVDEQSVTGQFLQGSSLVGGEFEIGLRGSDQAIGSPAVAYEPTYGLWLVSWDATDSSGGEVIYYVVLRPDGEVVVDKQGLGQAATHSELRATVAITEAGTHGIACSHNTTDYAMCGSVAASDDELVLTSLSLDVIPPSQGGIELISKTLVYIDADPPTSTLTSLTAGAKYAYTGTMIVGGEALDPGSDSEASGIARVEVSENSGAWNDAAGSETWTYTYTLPMADGWYTLQTRATDRVGNQETPGGGVTFYLDRTPPDVGFTSAGTVSTTLAGGRWTVALEGTVSDAGSDVDSVEVMLSPNGDGWQRATLNGGNWSLNYRLVNGLPDPTSVYTVLVRATDTALGPDGPGNRGDPETWPLYVDNAPPVVALTSTGPSTTTITDTLRIGGVITDPTSAASGVQGLEIALTRAGESPGAWGPATVESPGAIASTWYYSIPAGLENTYQIDLCGTDVLGNRCDEESTPYFWRGEVDTLAPRRGITVTYRGAGSAAQTIYEGYAVDTNLTTAGFGFPCALQRADRGYYDNAWWSEITSDTRRLISLAPSCTLNGFALSTPQIEACDLHGHCDVTTTTLPSGYVSPTIASVVLTPTHEGALGTAGPVSLTVGAYALQHLRALTLTISDGSLYTTTWPCAPITQTVTDTLWATTWDPPDEGRYTMLSVAEDCSGTLQTDLEPPVLQPISVTVDMYEPVVTFPTTVVTTVRRLSLGRVALTGTASDTMGLENVELLASPWDEAFFDGAIWRYTWYLGGDPDGSIYPVTVRATDAAGHTDHVTRNVTVDLVPPAPVTITLSYTGTASAGQVAAGGTITESSITLNMDWTPSSDGSGSVTYWADWSTDPLLNPATLSLVAGRHYEEPALEPQALYAHLVIVDAYGNEQAQTAGPVYVDAPTTPDYIADLGYHGWMESGCSQVGADHELARNAYSGATLADVQRLYAAWDATALRLAWTGANWDSDGDLFVYLDTTSGGTATAYDPYGSGPTVTLPDMAADYLIWVEDGATARLMQGNGGVWQPHSTHPLLDGASYRLDTTLSPVHTDLLIPWAWLGSPASLELVALASEEDALRVWAAAPDKNPLNSGRVVGAVALDYLDQAFDLTQQIRSPSLGAGVCPNGGHFADADLHVGLTADPPGVEVGFLGHDLPSLLTPGTFLDVDLNGEPDVNLPVDVRPVLVGHNEMITYTLVYTNEGTAVAPGAVVTLTARGGVVLAGGSPRAFSLTGVSGTLCITGTVDKTLPQGMHSAEVDGVVADAAHGEFDWLWVQHGVDTAAPASLAIETPVAYVSTYTNTVSGSVDDPSGVPTITLQVYDVPTGTLVTEIACADPSPSDGLWSCRWNVGGAADGDQFDLRARAVDRFGNESGWTTPMRRVEVDAQLPQIYLSDATRLALTDEGYTLLLDELGLTGHVKDEREAGQVGVCLGPLGGPAGECALHSVTPITSPTIGHWYVQAPILGDGDGTWQTLYFYALDSVGNRSSTTETHAVRVDVVAPVVTVTARLETLPQGMAIPMIEGAVSDGYGVATIMPDTQLYIARPDGYVRWYPLTFDGDDWSFTRIFTETGDYTFGYEFRDLVDNLQPGGPFPLTVYESDQVVDLSLALSASSDPAITDRPLTYTFTISNAGPGVATTSTLTVTLPAPVSLEWASQAYGTFDDALVFDVGDVLTSTPTLVQVRVSMPLTTTGTLVCAAEAGTGAVEMRPADNRPWPLSTSTAQPITGLEATSDSPTILGKVTTISVTLVSGTAIGFKWSLGDGGTSWTFGGYEVGGTSPVTHVYPAVGVYHAVITASNLVNVVTATTQITTDIPLAVPLLEEGFEDGFLPPGWQRTEPFEDECWHWSGSNAHTGLHSAMYDDLFGSQDGWLVTSQVTPTLRSELVFWQYQNYAPFYERHSIWVSLGSGDPKDGEFVLVTELGPGTEGVWEEVRVGLSAYAGQPIYLAFRYEGDWSDEWFVDDVQVTAPLVLVHDGPTPLGQMTTMTASIATGSNPVFQWDLGDWQTASGTVVTNTYAAPGDYTVVVTASNSVSLITGTMGVPVRGLVYLPLLLKGYRPLCPDDYEPDDTVGQANIIATDGTPQEHVFGKAGDADWIAFDVPDDGVSYVIETFNLMGGADTVIYLYDSDGELLLDWNDDAGPAAHASRLEFNPYHAGTFYVGVVGYDPAVWGCEVLYSVRVAAQD